jgi:hypothetical protein
MRYFSTRGAGPVSLDEALVSGIAADGGLFLPERLPQFTIEAFAGARSIAEVARSLLEPFFAGSTLREDLQDILSETFSFPIPVTPFLPGRDLPACWSSITGRRRRSKTSAPGSFPPVSRASKATRLIR